MSTPGLLHGFAYGEHLEGPQQRSLGFRLLTPAEPQGWSAEVEALARALQGAPYPDQWPPTNLFCSVLLADGQRLVAMARYGLADHTPSRRRSGLELVGVVGPAGLGVASALAVYHWLEQRRGSGADDLRSYGDGHALADIVAAAPAQPTTHEALPVLPIRIWQEGALLFAATAPSDPDRRLGLLGEGAVSTWQWLPLVGGDFPLTKYTQRGPLVAWTPHLAGVALKLDGRGPAPVPARSTAGFAIALLAAVLLFLLGANLWATLSLREKIRTADQLPATAQQLITAPRPGNSGDRLTHGLYELLRSRGAITDGNQGQLLGTYESLAAEDGDLRLSTTEGKLTVGALGLLSRRSPGQVEAVVREALSDRGYDPALVDRACQLVRDRLGAKGAR
jgi:hypothetical protein